MSFWVGGLFEWLVIMIVIFLFAIRSTPFQVFLAKKTTSFLSKELNAKVTIEKVDFVFIDWVNLHGIYIEDQRKDTLAYIQSLDLAIGDFDFSKNYFYLNSVDIKKPIFNLINYKNDTSLNLNFLTNYFSSENIDTTKSQFDFQIKNIEIKEGRFKFWDFNEELEEKGIDYDHLDINNININFKNFKLVDDSILVDIKSLSLKDRCGFELTNLSANTLVCPKGIVLDDLVIKTPQSSISTKKLEMLTNSYSSYSNYVHEVSYHTTLNKSIVAISDVAYFAPILWGSDEIVTISTRADNPIYGMKFKNLKLNINSKLYLHANFTLPDFSNLFSTKLNFNINELKTSFEKIEKIKMPDILTEKPLSFSKQIKSIGNLKLKNINLSGTLDKFTLKANSINSSIGELSLKKGITFKYDNSKKMYVFQSSKNQLNNIIVSSFNLGNFLDNTLFGKVSGEFSVDGKGLSSENLNINISGKLNEFNFNHYNYKNIEIEKGSLTTDFFNGRVFINDPNLKLNFDGLIDYSKKEISDFELHVKEASLSKLGFVEKDSLQISFNSTMKTNYFDLNKIEGTVGVNALKLKNGTKQFNLNAIELNINRDDSIDQINLNSDVVDGFIEGKIYFNTILKSLTHEVASVFPSYFDSTSYQHFKKESDFQYLITVKKKANDLIGTFSPYLFISNNTKINGSYDGDTDEFNMFCKSDSVAYNGIKFYNIDFYNQIQDSSIFIDNQISKIKINDSLSFQNFSFHNDGKNDTVNSIIKWGSVGDLKTHPGIISLSTITRDKNNLQSIVKPSFFYTKNHKWTFSENGEIGLINDLLVFKNLKINFKDQFISINGKLSEDKRDVTTVKVNNFKLEEINNIFQSKFNIAGVLNGTTEIASPAKDLFLNGGMNIEKFKLDQYEIGNISINNSWNSKLKSIRLNGDLVKGNNKRFSFDGNYFLDNKKEDLNLNLDFDYTDISFVNALLPNDQINNIKGLLYGKLSVHGQLFNPQIDGNLDLYGGNIKVDILGVNFGLAGQIQFNKQDIFLNQLPIIDEEGNAGYLTGSIFHNEFKDWNCNVDINLEEDYFKINEENQWEHLPLNKFLLMNSKYKEGSVFYGTAYGTGIINVFFYKEHLDITVGISTKEGSNVYLPIFGSEELEEDDFIVFENKYSKTVEKEREIDLSGVSLDLDLNVNEEAKIHLLLDETETNKLDAIGKGKIQIGLNQLNDISMSGEYTINQGDFKLNLGGIVSKKFSLQKGGTVRWSGDPYNAIIDVVANYNTNATIFDASPNVLDEERHRGKSDVNCGIVLNGSLMKPTINFDITSSNASQSEKSILSRIKSNQDELNKQFFSLLLWNKFQPIDGSIQANASGAIGDIVSGQLNKLLSQASEDFKLGVDVNTGENLKTGNVRINTEFDLDKNDRLTLKTSFGYANNLVGGKNVSSLIGDVSLDYKLNKKGTFRAKIFNESNDYNVIQDNRLGGFTQGVSLFYTEDFHSMNDFKLIQYFLNIFRSENKKRKFHNNNKKVAIPNNKKYLLKEYYDKKSK